MSIRPLRVSPERVRWDGETTQLNISFHPAWQVRRHWGCSRERMPGFWRQKGQVAAAIPTASLDLRSMPLSVATVAVVWRDSGLPAVVLDLNHHYRFTRKR